MRPFPYKIGFIGAGHLGVSLIQAVLDSGFARPREVAATTAHIRSRLHLRRRFRIQTPPTNQDLAKGSQTIVLAVRPQQMEGVLDEIANLITSRQLIISVAAGLTTSFYSHRLPRKTHIIRAMPNRAILVGHGVTALFHRGATTKDRSTAVQIFSPGGIAFFVPRESWLNAVTAVCAAGLGFVFLYLKNFVEAAERSGLPATTAKVLVLQTVRGALEIAEGSHASLESQIRTIASRGGTTEAGLKVLRKNRFAKIVTQSIMAAFRRAQELGR